jgi:hypothetical protein
LKELQVQETETDRKGLERKLIALKAKGQISMQRIASPTIYANIFVFS